MTQSDLRSIFCGRCHLIYYFAPDHEAALVCPTHGNAHLHVLDDSDHAPAPRSTAPNPFAAEAAARARHLRRVEQPREQVLEDRISEEGETNDE